MLTVKKSFDPKRIGQDVWRKIASYLEYWDNVWTRNMHKLPLENPYLDKRVLYKGINVFNRNWNGINDQSGIINLLGVQHSYKSAGVFSISMELHNLKYKTLIWRCPQCNVTRLIRTGLDEMCSLPTFEGYAFMFFDKNARITHLSNDSYRHIVLLCNCILKEYFPKAHVRKTMISASSFPAAFRDHQLKLGHQFAQYAKWDEEKHVYVVWGHTKGKKKIVTSDGSPIVYDK